MSWMQNLYETYEVCQDEVGVIHEHQATLLPIYHSTQQAQIEVAVDIDGNFCFGMGRVLTDKKERTTIIPCTEKSAGRSGSSVSPHPLFDKLCYIAGDYKRFVQDKKKDNYDAYIKQLKEWCESPFSNPKVFAVYEYLKKGTLMQDLAAEHILYRDQFGAFPEKWDGEKENMPEIFSACPSAQVDAFVRFRVVGGGVGTRIWQEKEVWQSWIDYQNSLNSDSDYCYVLGKKMPYVTNASKKIRNEGDSAKLISGNDTSGFTFRGRFQLPLQASCVGRETSEKAHNALRWLISKQGYRNGDQAILAWAVNKNQFPPQIVVNDIVDIWECLNEPSLLPASTDEEFAAKFRNALAGYMGGLKGWEEAAVIGLDSATPGRMSIFYYREMYAKDFIERLINWHKSCSWVHTYRLVKNGTDAKGKTKWKPAPFIGAPAPIDIVKAAYGPNVDDKLKKCAVERLLPCIVDGAALPADIMHKATARASNAVAMKENETKKTRSIACALIRKYYNDRFKGDWKVALNTECDDRDYLFGRALAYARKLEELAQWSAGATPRQTNAERLQVMFTQHPMRTWKDIYDRLLPYLGRLHVGKIANKYENGMHDVISRIKKEDFNNKPLSPIYLLGYESQLNAFAEDYNKNKNQSNEEETNNEQSAE